jgi:putative ABC transport system permease protein
MVRQLRSDRATNVALIVIVFLTSLYLSATPRLFDAMSDDAILETIEGADVATRNVSVGRSSRILPAGSGDVLVPLDTQGTRFRDLDLPESLQAIISDHQYVVDSPSFIVIPPEAERASLTRLVRMRYQQGIEDHVRLVAGHFPVPREPVPVEMGEDAEIVIVPLYELAVSAETQSELQVELGDRLLLTPDARDPLYHDMPIASLSYYVAIEISGVIEPIQPDEDYWNLDFRLHRPRIVFDIDFNPIFVFTTGLLGPSDYRQLLRDTRGALWAYTWRYSVQPGKLNPDDAHQLAGDLRKLGSTFPPIGLASLTETGVTTGLSQLLDEFLDQRAATIAVMSLASIGLLIVALAVAALLAALSAERRRDATRLLRSRGASIRQLALARLAEGLILSVPAAAIGYIVASLLVPGA